MYYKLHIYHGNGKGKTTAVTGLAVRALGAGLRVSIVYFDKGHRDEREHYAERAILRGIENCTLHPTGCERLLKAGGFRFGIMPEDLTEAQRALKLSADLIASEEQDILILDEILAAVAYELISEEEVMKLLELYDKSRHAELVLTGHRVWPELIDRADLVTELKMVKHYFDTGLKARWGIDY